MSDDLDLQRLFTEEPAPADEAFVAGVTARIAWRRRLAWALPAGAALLLVFAIWATWPAAYTFSGNAIAGLVLIGASLGEFFNSPVGMIAVTALLATAAFWAWMYERLRAA